MTPGSLPWLVLIAGRLPSEAAGDAAFVCAIRERLTP